MGLVLSCWTVALRSWASALRKSSASGSDLLRRLGLSIGIAAHRHFCTSERRYDGTTVRRNDARDGGRFSAPLRASSIYIFTYLRVAVCGGDCTFGTCGGSLGPGAEILEFCHFQGPEHVKHEGLGLSGVENSKKNDETSV